MSNDPSPCSLQHDSLQSILHGTTSSDCPDVAVYNGIPYASLAKRWTRATLRSSLGADEFNATQYGPKCPQPEDLNNTADFGPHIPFPNCGSDEFACLNLNVSVPSFAGKAGTLLPVMTWIHGGSLLFGANSDPIWEPSRLVQTSIDSGKPMIVVSVNYRLGPFGFLAPKASLSGDDPSSLGNFGFHDQYLALQWIQQHIAGFGGDPSQVTIAGESAGGCSVHAQVVHQDHLSASKQPKLFQRAVMQSGNLAVMGFWDRSRMGQVWDSAVTEAGLDLMDDTETLLEQFRQLDADTLLNLPSLKMDGYPVLLDDDFVSSPLTDSKGDFLHVNPVTVDGVMHGDNADEGNIFRQSAQNESSMESLLTVATTVLGEEGCGRLLSAYGLDDWKDLTVTERSSRLYRFPEDARFYLPSDELVAAWPRAAFYHMSATSPCQGSLWPNDSFHTLDLLYLFGNFDSWLRDDGKTDDLRLGQEMRAVWIAFVYGEEPWPGAFKGSCVTFGKEKVSVGLKDDVRASQGGGEVDVERKRRVETLHELGFVNIVQIATRVFP